MAGEDDIVRILRNSIANVIAVYRFGSSVHGSLRRDSDIDVAVLAAAPLTPLARFALQEDLAVELNRDVDLVDLRSASTVMRVQVISTGILLESLDDYVREEFEARAFSDYARLNEERREILKQVAQDGRVYG